MKQTRRDFLQFSITAAGISALGMPAFAQNGGKDLVIAYNTGLPSWDPTTGPSAVNPKLQALYLSVFDRFIQQEPDLSFSPGLLTEWGLNGTTAPTLLRKTSPGHWNAPAILPPEIQVSLSGRIWPTLK